MATLKSSRHAPRDEARPENSPGRFVAVEEIAWTMARYDWPRFHNKMTQSGYISTERDGYFVVTKPDRGSRPGSMVGAIEEIAVNRRSPFDPNAI